MDSSEITLEAVPSVGDVSAEEWNACDLRLSSPLLQERTRFFFAVDLAVAALAT